MRFVVLVEGNTEEDNLADFMSRWINPQLKEPVEIEIDRFKGNTDFYKRAAKKAKDYLSEPDSNETIGIIGLLDLYVGELRREDKTPFYSSDKITVQDRYDWAVTHFQDQVNHEKFRMFMAVHEVEAWLLSQPNIFKPEVRKVLDDECREPEKINFDEPPKKLLNKIYLDKFNKRYKETVEGRNLFTDLDPTIAYEKCPYLKKMLDGMLAMARGAGL